MKKALLFLFLFSTFALFASLTDYEDEFGFRMEKPRHGRYYFQKELLSIDQDPQILNYKPLPDEQIKLEIVQSAPETELDRFSLSDTTLVINTEALTDLDLFSSLQLDTSLGDTQAADYAEDFVFSYAQPADYNLYIKMEIPQLNAKPEKQIEFIPVTAAGKQALRQIIPQIQALSYQIDFIYEQENKIIPQNGSLDFIITITPDGVSNVQHRLVNGKGFSRGFISKASEAVMRWRITSPVKVQYVLTRNYLARY
jgi:hypothetical protein